MTKHKNANMRKAAATKDDEFYTQLTDIEREVSKYKAYFKNKIVYCNCDLPTQSNFFKYFSLNFEHLGLKKLIATSFNKSGRGRYIEYSGDKNGNNIPDPEEIGIKELKGDGDFRSDESVSLLKQADIIITNPPFSIFGEYISQLMKYNKKFLIIGHHAQVVNKIIFPLIKDNKIWLGHHTGLTFKRPNAPDMKIGMAGWYTNLQTPKRAEDIILIDKYNKNNYEKYDNYNAINIDKVKHIPMDYKGEMGVPISFLHKYNPNQFDIIDGFSRYSFLTGATPKTKGKYLTNINGKPKFSRIVIKNRRI